MHEFLEGEGVEDDVLLERRRSGRALPHRHGADRVGVVRPQPVRAVPVAEAEDLSREQVVRQGQAVLDAFEAVKEDFIIYLLIHIVVHQVVHYVLLTSN